MVLVFDVLKALYQHSALFYLIPLYYRRMQSMKINVQGVSADMSISMRLASLVHLLCTTELHVQIAERYHPHI
jgi:hypothetical protein